MTSPTQPGSDTDAAVEQSNPEVDRLVGLVQTQQETIDYLVQYIERVEAQLNDRIDTIETSGGAAAPVMDAGGGGGQQQQAAGPDPIDWATISGPARIKAWQDLAGFVEGLVVRYSLQLEILPCWWMHGEAIEELTSLWQARQVAYAAGSDASMASWWQDLLERSRMRMREIFGSCRDGHIDSSGQRWMTDENRSALARAIEEEARQFG
ncbi:MAG TPA: DUF4913 domain-containing protein [Mycobacteriales bacterium]|jgi:hypothetical protein|nr:DUF4913 domain-containing protein [Mycobacteriales bacterium]